MYLYFFFESIWLKTIITMKKSWKYYDRNIKIIFKEVKNLGTENITHVYAPTYYYKPISK